MQKYIDNFCKKDKWKTFIESYIGKKKSNLSIYKSSSNLNKEEFKVVI